jgi:hypothetical protein
MGFLEDRQVAVLRRDSGHARQGRNLAELDRIEILERYNGSRHLVGVCGIFRGDRCVYYPDKLIRVRLLPMLAEASSFFEGALTPEPRRSIATVSQGRPSPYIGQILDALVEGSYQGIGITGVPYRIRTGVAAVREGQRSLFRTSTDGHG